MALNSLTEGTLPQCLINNLLCYALFSIKPMIRSKTSGFFFYHKAKHKIEAMFPE